MALEVQERRDQRRLVPGGPLQYLCNWIGRRFRHGTLELRVPDGRTWTLGQGSPRATLLLRDESVLLRLLRHPELQFGEAYVEGAWQPADSSLLPVLEVCQRNLAAADRQDAARWGRRILSRIAEWNDARRSSRNARHHYDHPPEFYRSFLDADLHYSCAYFRDAGMTLEQAQQAKCELIARKLDLRPGAQVLDIGCGFGSLALYLAEHCGAKVTGITLSPLQLKTAQQRSQERALADRVDFRLQDYRGLRGRFDAIVSVGMFEHVGRPQYLKFFRALGRRLKPDGVALVHTIGRSGPPGATNPWIRKRIFPGGYIPAASEMLAAVERAGLVLSDLEIWRGHYARTLRHWHERFQSARAGWASRFGERFCRMWEFYLQAAEAAFRWGDLVVFQAQILRDPRRLPETRGYLYANPAEQGFGGPPPHHRACGSASGGSSG